MLCDSPMNDGDNNKQCNIETLMERRLAEGPDVQERLHKDQMASWGNQEQSVCLLNENSISNALPKSKLQLQCPVPDFLPNES